MVGNLSCSDLRGTVAHRESLESLLFPVYKFLETRNILAFNLRPDQIRSVQPTDTVSIAARLALDSRIHRVWIVDKDDKPIGVVTLSDMLSLFLPFEACRVQETKGDSGSGTGIPSHSNELSA